MEEREILDALRRNVDAAERALVAGEMTALRALAEQEARYLDELRALWGQRGH